MNKKWIFSNNGTFAIIKEDGRLPECGMCFYIPYGQLTVCRQFNKPEDLTFYVKGNQVSITVDLGKDLVEPAYVDGTSIEDYMLKVSEILNGVNVTKMIKG